MGLQFSDDGPEFPSALIEEMRRGDVVFLCGAGVSAPQMPGFAGLVTSIFERRGWEPNASERLSFQNDRFEEGLGTLARRLSQPTALYDTVADVLKIPPRPDLSQHRTLLRLSRRLDNQPVIVTTNFDTLFERAARKSLGTSLPELSYSGQSLPAPGGLGFAGIIHLHGRLEDKTLGLRRTDLVLTSAEYGDAYMRSGWASRFLFDLTRCKTVVLIGYSASDAPVRYFLNVLEADRDRFSDLKLVYALDADNGRGPQGVHDAWGALAVVPLPYVTGDATRKGGPHGALWGDLAQLADTMEKPRASRAEAAARILALPFKDSTSRDRETLDWALERSNDQFALIIKKAGDPSWLDHLRRRKILPEAMAPHVIADWCEKRWTERTALDAAIDWLDQLGREFGVALETRLWRNRQPVAPQPWRLAWQLLARATPRTENATHLAFRTKDLLDRGELFDSDLRRAVDLFTPKLQIEKRWRGPGGDTANPVQLHDIVRPTMAVIDNGGLAELAPALISNARAPRVATLAMEALRSSLLTAAEAGLIGADLDQVNAGVPAIDDHAQNRHHHNFVPLVRLLADLFAALAASAPDAARHLADRWNSLGNRLTNRLYLYALRNREFYSSNEAVDGLLALSREDFWDIRREWVLLAQERAHDAPPEKIDGLIARILSEGPTLYEQASPAEPGETDWRPNARDRAIWLRLVSLQMAGALSESGGVALNQILSRRPHLNRVVEDYDLFPIYHGEPYSVVGDPAPLEITPPEDRLEAAHKLLSSPDPNTQESWQAYAAADPLGALQALEQGDPLANAALWEGLFNAVSGPGDQELERSQVKAQVLERAFAHLEAVDVAFLQDRTHALVVALRAAQQAGLNVSSTWWDRLWEVADVPTDNEAPISTERFYERVINSAAGWLAQTLLLRLRDGRKRRRKPAPADLSRLDRILDSSTISGVLARGELTASAGFLWSISPSRLRRGLFPRLGLDTVEGAALRDVLTQYANLGPTSAGILKTVLLRGVAESRTTGMPAANVAAKLLYPVLSAIRGDPGPRANLSSLDVKRALGRARPGVRAGAALLLRNWLPKLPGDPAVIWRDLIGPLFEATWPDDDRRLRDEESSRQLGALATQAGGAFPEALALIKPHLAYCEREWGDLSFLKSATCTQYPSATLELAWVLCGPPSQSNSYDLAEILDALRAADPIIATDRRFQWLEDRAVRWK